MRGRERKGGRGEEGREERRERREGEGEQWKGEKERMQTEQSLKDIIPRECCVKC